ncbi:MAG: hypothetical protein ACYTAO_17995, partial [Planctomycetota bacterium]
MQTQKWRRIRYLAYVIGGAALMLMALMWWARTRTPQAHAATLPGAQRIQAAPYSDISILWASTTLTWTDVPSTGITIWPIPDNGVTITFFYPELGAGDMTFTFA